MSSTLRGDDVQGFDTNWDEVLLSLKDTPHENMLESMYKNEASRSRTIQDHLCPVQPRIIGKA